MPKRSKPKSKPKNLPLGSALKSFIGHLEGSGKAEHTVAAYRFDLQNFAEFLQAEHGAKSIPDLRTLVRKDLERYHEWLKQSGQKTNTRRRKLMTVRKLMHYLTARKKLDLDIAKKLPAPEKIERIPETLDLVLFRKSLAAISDGTLLGRRNRALVGLLADTGCGVSEAAKLRWAMIDLKARRVHFAGKAEREVSVSEETAAELAKLRQDGALENAGDELCFVGFNRYGPMRLGKRALGITPRGIEVLLKSIAGKLGYARVTPRTLRHSAVVEWFRAGIAEDEIQRRLGLRTAYAFRIYAPIFAGIRDARTKSSSAPTSNA